MDFVLDEEVDKWDEGSEETPRNPLTILQCTGIQGRHGNDSQCPGKGTH